jgi:outer membrane receptor protein involved in Fe transport
MKYMPVKLSLALLICFLSKDMYSQADDEISESLNSLYEMSLEELMQVQIKGISKNDESLNETPMAVYLMSKDEMLRYGTRSLYDLLGHTPGYAFYNTDYYGQFGVVGRGKSSIWRYAMGFELMEIEDFGHFILSPHFFKNVEIARGPAGLMWGGSAEAGLINFNIRDDLDGLETHTGFGNFNRQSYDVLYGKKFEKKGDGFFVGFHFEKQDFENAENNLEVFDKDFLPYIKKNGINNSWSILSKFKNKGAKLIFYKDHLDHVLPHYWGWSDTSMMQLIDTLSQKNGDLHDEFETTAIRGEYHFFDNNQNVDVYIHSSYYQRRWFITGLASLTQRKSIVGFGSTFNIFQSRLKLNIGGDLYAKDIANDPSNNSFIAIQHGVNWWGSSYYPSETISSNCYVQVKYELHEKIKLITGGRVDYQDVADTTTISGPRIGVFYLPNKNLTFKYLFNRTNRMPAGNELSEGTFISGPENLKAHEIVAMYSLSDKLNTNLTLVNQQLNGMLTQKTSSTGVNSWINGASINTNGIELALQFKPCTSLLFYWNGHYHDVKAIDKKIDSITYSVDDKMSDGRISFVPKHAHTFGVEKMLFNFLKVSATGRIIADIPYFTIDGKESSVNVFFLDLGLRTKYFWKERMSLSINTINTLNNEKGVPAFGEHFNNTNGLVEPEGFRIYGRIGFNIP